MKRKFFFFFFKEYADVVSQHDNDETPVPILCPSLPGKIGRKKTKLIIIKWKSQKDMNTHAHTYIPNKISDKVFLSSSKRFLMKKRYINYSGYRFN